MRNIMTRAQALKYGAGAALFTLGVNAHAELPAGVATAIDAAEADGLTLVGLMAAAGAAVWLISKVLARFGLRL